MKYEIKNQPFTVATFHMEKGEQLKCQSGAMAWMSPGIQMETQTGGLGGMFKKASRANLSQKLLQKHPQKKQLKKLRRNNQWQSQQHRSRNSETLPAPA